jgi:hypothetical protein
MSNTAAHLVDRVLPDVPVRPWTSQLPFELRALAAFKADVLGALGRIFVAAIFARYRKRARGVECGAVTFVQRFGGSLNLNVHFHVVVLDGVFTREANQRASFRTASPPTVAELEAIVVRVRAHQAFTPTPDVALVRYEVETMGAKKSVGWVPGAAVQAPP